ncbi:uncharacterized protein SCHCODRAFT_02608131 [Schizophyllum commune H4-8]|uniref:uncharacterized protein n=1 Tax=Schizophyllum commune (strain H4-8 / FGSC 9210) TaxID=578458 RepID=UPI00215E8D02|nr:uncharacterized protein SCHCODRAFT_02608131 [Schizophyllum commune H4-8]KAI5900524.1 hypothetical protein SCHCODRAFT_02608131 [Schizophyllum commune H4-8]
MRERPPRRALTSDSAPYASDSARLHAQTRQKHFLSGFCVPPTTAKTAFLLSTCSSKPDLKPSHEDLGDFGPLGDGASTATAHICFSSNSGVRRRRSGSRLRVRQRALVLKPDSKLAPPLSLLAPTCFLSPLPRADQCFLYFEAFPAYKFCSVVVFTLPWHAISYHNSKPEADLKPPTCS